MSSRLKKRIAAMDMNSFEATINQTSKKGRDILKSLQDFKFTLEQTARLLNNNQELSQGMIQKRKEVDVISSKLYQIVFDIENMDLLSGFNNQNPVIEEAPTKSPMGEDSVEQNQPNQPNQPAQPNQPNQPAQPKPPVSQPNVPPSDSDEESK